MPQENGLKKQRDPSELILKNDLNNSGYSENVADKIWKWYNPIETK
jgi:hypothetical protein